MRWLLFFRDLSVALVLDSCIATLLKSQNYSSFTMPPHCCNDHDPKRLIVVFFFFLDVFEKNESQKRNYTRRCHTQRGTLAENLPDARSHSVTHGKGIPISDGSNPVGMVESRFSGDSVNLFPPLKVTVVCCHSC